jgi:diguanylate cyclase (GGDEF)-like protein
VFAFGSSLSWYLAETAVGYPYSHTLIPVWNAFVRFVFFAVIALLLSALRGHLKYESRLAKTDALTGLANLRAFLEQLEHDLALTARTGNPLTLAYVDLDDFKSINDSQGHSAGDNLLRAVATRLISATRRTDTVARLGGDEFGIILPATDFDGAKAILRKIRRSLGAPYEGIEYTTCSVGAVVLRERTANAAAALAAADRLMYAAKRSGKNAFVVQEYSPLVDTPDTPDKLVSIET